MAAKFKLKKLAELGVDDLLKKRSELELALLKQRAQIAKGSALENPKMVREIRKNLARINQKIAEKSR